MKGAIARAEEICGGDTGCGDRRTSSPTRPIRRSTDSTTAEEIWHDTGGRVDVVVSGIGTGGTLTGCGEALKPRLPGLR